MLVEGDGGVITANDRAWDAGVVRFAPGETKRRVYDFHMINVLGSTGGGGLGPGFYRFRGAFGTRWAANPPDAAVPAR